MGNDKNEKMQLQLRRGVRVNAVILVVCASNFINVTRHSDIRAVDMLSILALGIAVGVFIVNLVLDLRMKKNTNTN